VSVQPTVSPSTDDQSTSVVQATERRSTTSARRVRAVLRTGIRAAVQVVVVVVLSAGLVAALVGGGLFMAPTIGVAANAVDAPSRRPPIIPPSVPLGAREDWAIWSYVDRINQAWGKDWPLVIQWFEELDARYPGNPMVLDKLYVSYLEDARNLQAKGDLQGARRRYEQAARFDPDRGVAQEFLAELDKQRTVPGR
jgi:hypothetical protein